MKCPYCHGKGSRHVVDQALKTCLYCQGTGKIKPTHQEYIQNCNTEELAEVISDIARSCYECGKNPMKNFCYFGHCLLADMGAEVWLKEKKE